MTGLTRLVRSPDLMSREDTALLVVDVQDRLLPAMPDRQRLVWNVGRLIDGARLFGVPVLATEQYPQGLGPTTAELAQRLGEIPSKRTFSCGGCPDLFEPLKQRGVFRILVVGIEAHVCVQQTVLDLMHAGFRLYVAADAVASRQEFDYQIALRRMELSGATLTTTESALFEWCDSAAAPEFKQLNALVKPTAPPTASSTA